MTQLDRTAGIQAVRKPLHAGLDPGLRIVGPVQSVDVGLNHMISQLAHGLEDQVVGREIRWSHAGRVVTQDLHQSGFEEIHLGDDARVVESGKVRVRPAACELAKISSSAIFIGSPPRAANDSRAPSRGCYLRVRTNLVTFGNHTMDQGLVIGVEDVGPVVAVDKERGVHVVALQRVEDLGRINIRPVVERQRHGSRHRAAGDDGSDRDRRARRCGRGCCCCRNLGPWGGLRSSPCPGGDPGSGLAAAGRGWGGQHRGGPGAEEYEVGSDSHFGVRRQVSLTASKFGDENK